MRWTALFLGAALAAFLATDRRFTILDDETTIVTVARKPAAETVRLFVSGPGEHEHPPLSDLLLHYWIPAGGGAQWSLRLPSMILYLLGLVALALTARQMAGPAAYRYLLMLGVFWPFGFHFGRLAGWYSFCFFLVAVATWAYVRYMERPRTLIFAVFLAAALALVYSNYYGWLVIGCFAIDVVSGEKRQRGTRLLLVTGVTLAIAYIPLWTVFRNQLLSTAYKAGGSGWISKILQAAYNFYSIFVSESVAPWFWYWSVPASLCIVTSLILAFSALPGRQRKFLLYFALLFAGLTAMGSPTKRLLFISGWMLLAFALALSAAHRKVVRGLLVASLLAIAGIGWAGTIARNRYAAMHFIEPWAEIADQAAQALRGGSVIVTNNVSFLFDLNYSLVRLHLTPPSAVPGWANDPRVIRVEAWNAQPHTGLQSVFYARGVNRDWTEQTALVEGWLGTHCVSTWEQFLVPDSGFALKSRFFREAGQEPYRVVLKRFDCAARK